MKKEYIKIDAPTRQKPDAKYIVTAPYCHWIQERNVTVLALLTYTTQNTQVTWSNVKSAIKEAPTEEVLCQRIAEHECYTELVETIITAVTDVSQAEIPSINYKEKVDMINGVVKFIREKGVKPSCKLPSEVIVFTDFITAAGDEATMDSAKNIVDTKVPADKFLKDWKSQHDNIIRNKNKMKQREYLEKRWGGYLLPPSREQKDPKTSSDILFGSNTTETSTYQKQQQITNYKPNISEIITIQRPPITRYRADFGQHLSIWRQAGRAKPISEHNRIMLHDVESTQT